MADVKQLVQNILEKNAVGAKEQFSAILEQKIAAIIQDVIPLVAENMLSDATETEEELEEGMKLIKTHTEGPHSAKVYKDTEWGEHRVKYFKNGSHLKDADSHHDDADDAHGTAKAQLKKMNEEVELEEKAKFDDDEGDEYAEKKARKDKERQRSDARQSKKKEVEEEVNLQERIAGSEYAPADLVDLHVQHQKNLMHINSHLMSGGSITSIADTVGKAKKLEGQINKHPQTLEFHSEHGFDAEHPAKKIARNTAHLHEEEQLDELKKSTLGSYIKKAADDKVTIGSKLTKRLYAGGSTNKSTKDLTQKYVNRHTGIERAVSRLTKEDTILSRILTNLAEKAKFDDDDGSEHEEKTEKKKKELARSKAREAKKQDSED